MIPKSSFLLFAPLLASVLADGDYPWQAPSASDRKLFLRFRSLRRLYRSSSKGCVQWEHIDNDAFTDDFLTRTEPLPYGEHFGQSWISPS